MYINDKSYTFKGLVVNIIILLATGDNQEYKLTAQRFAIKEQNNFSSIISAGVQYYIIMC